MKLENPVAKFSKKPYYNAIRHPGAGGFSKYIYKGFYMEVL